jgi:hypothetical protein
MELADEEADEPSTPDTADDARDVAQDEHVWRRS